MKESNLCQNQTYQIGKISTTEVVSTIKTQKKLKDHKHKPEKTNKGKHETIPKLTNNHNSRKQPDITPNLAPDQELGKKGNHKTSQPPQQNQKLFYTHVRGASFI